MKSIGNIKLVAVVVTYNRLEKLKKTLSCYESQTEYCSDLIVVNNCSTDGTDKFLEQWSLIQAPFNKHILNTDSNIGGAGGFHKGMEYAMTLSPDWIWVSDDDAYPEENVFEQLLLFIANNSDDRIAAVCSSVVNPDGNYAFNHRAKLLRKRTWSRSISSLSDYSKTCFDIDITSYVGSAYNIEALKKYGLCNSDFFIYFDDTEHSLRMRKYGRIICLPYIRVLHDIPCFPKNVISYDLDWRDYYAIRNRLYVYLNYHKTTARRYICSVKRGFKLLYWMNVYRGDSMLLMKTALNDAKSGNLGLHPVYKPGFKIHNPIPQKTNLLRRIYRFFYKNKGL